MVRMRWTYYVVSVHEIHPMFCTTAIWETQTLVQKQLANHACWNEYDNEALHHLRIAQVQSMAGLLLSGKNSGGTAEDDYRSWATPDHTVESREYFNIQTTCDKYMLIKVRHSRHTFCSLENKLKNCIVKCRSSHATHYRWCSPTLHSPPYYTYYMVWIDYWCGWWLTSTWISSYFCYFWNVRGEDCM